MKNARSTIVNALIKHFPREKAMTYEKAIFNVATGSYDPEVHEEDDFVELYTSVAYERVAQLINAPTETDRLVIVVDMQADDGSLGAVRWDSCVYDEHRERYEASLNRSQQRPKPVKGVHLCKDPKCRSDVFYIWSLQTRGGDEGMTHYRQCAKCGKRGKE